MCQDVTLEFTAHAGRMRRITVWADDPMFVLSPLSVHLDCSSTVHPLFILGDTTGITFQQRGLYILDLDTVLESVNPMEQEDQLEEEEENVEDESVEVLEKDVYNA